jgi:hypothetical protein
MKPAVLVKPDLQRHSYAVIFLPLPLRPRPNPPLANGERTVRGTEG